MKCSKPTCLLVSLYHIDEQFSITRVRAMMGLWLTSDAVDAYVWGCHVQSDKIRRKIILNEIAGTPETNYRSRVHTFLNLSR